jgi:hypothetical protein
LEEHILQHERYPRLHVDKGKEFYNATVQGMLRRYESQLYSTFGSNTHAMHAERCIRTLKGRIFRWMNFTNTWRWIDVVPQIVRAYNTATHRTFKSKFSPDQVHHQAELTPVIRQMLYGKQPETSNHSVSVPETSNTRKKLLKEGATVRLSQLPFVFHKEQYPMNSVEIYRVKSAEVKEGLPVYRLEDLKRVPVPGVFYHNELVPTAEKEQYAIDQILKTRGRGKKRQHLVSFIGYPSSFNEWIPADQVEKI